MPEKTVATSTDRLQLTKETLRALTRAELTLVAGGRAATYAPAADGDGDAVHIC